MAIPYQTAKLKSANALAMAIWDPTTKFNSHQYFGYTVHYNGSMAANRMVQYHYYALLLHLKRILHVLFFNSPFETGQDNKLTTGRPEDVVGTATDALWREGIFKDSYTVIQETHVSQQTRQNVCESVECFK